MKASDFSIPGLCPRLVRTGLAALCLAGSALAGQGQAPGPAPRNVYTAGGEVRPAQPVRGDLVAAGGRIVLEQPVGGDAALAGGSVDVRAPVGDDLRVAGGSIGIENKVGGDLFAAGADVALRPGAVVTGAAELNAASIVVQGRIDGGLRGRAQKIVVDGEVAGPTHLVAERIELGANARLTGPLTYVSPAEIVRAEGAVVQGPVTREAAPGGGPARAAGQGSGSGGFGAPGAVALYVALFAITSGFVLLMPRFTQAAAARLRAAPWTALGTGSVALVALPILTLLLFITLLGIPLGLALMALAPVLLLAGFAVGVLGLAGLPALASRGPARADRAGPRLGRLALTLLLVLLVGLVPVAGALFISLLGLAGLGAGLRQVRAGRAAVAAPAAPAPELPLPGRDVFPA